MKRRILTALAAVCFILGVLILVLTDWYTGKFNTSFAGLLFDLSFIAAFLALTIWHMDRKRYGR